MIRTTLLWLFVSGIAVYAWRDWYKALCAVVVMMAVIQHPDMPKTLLGIQGLNPWNIALASTMVAWWSARQREGLTWDMPRNVAVLATLYMLVALVASTRMIVDREVLHESVPYLVGEHFINVFKWVIPALMMFDGCRSRSRFKWALFSVLAVYFLLAVQVIRWVPFEYAMSGDSLEARSHKVIGNEIGYHRVNMSMMLAGASWAIFVTRVLATSWWTRLLVLGASLTALYGQALTAGRAGYVTWGIIGLALCLVRWKRYLALAPILVLAVISSAPGVSERMVQGFSEETRDTNSRLDGPEEETISFEDESEMDLYTVTSGRVVAWPFVLERISESPVVGYGKEAMRRTGLTAFLSNEFGEGFPHPHNAYLELLLDTGFFGFAWVIPFFILMLYRSLALFRDSRSPVFVATGGVSAALILALLVAAMGSQTFYPREGSVGMWVAMALTLRLWVERSRAESLAANGVVFSQERAPVQQRPAGWPAPRVEASRAPSKVGRTRRRQTSELDGLLFGARV